ncbi:hypothetical protein P4H42_29915 [Paenibacillus macerans]|nr:hypothetical protein [Paenibacillus macerans]MEC0333786.1 hypothetical protein [Paenibacillus macerans]
MILNHKHKCCDIRVQIPPAAFVLFVCSLLQALVALFPPMNAGQAAAEIS